MYYKDVLKYASLFQYFYIYTPLKDMTKEKCFGTQS